LQTLQKNLPADEQGAMTAILKIDKDTQMGLVNDIKQDLREAGILTVHYSATKNNS
jgi:biopolymer transport protein ExbD